LVGCELGIEIVAEGAEKLACAFDSAGCDMSPRVLLQPTVSAERMTKLLRHRIDPA
jgi:hypothetical protein